jgi:hypothetical protein
MWTYYLDTVRIGALRDYIQEWRSPDFHPLYVQPFIWMLLAILAAIGLSGRRVDGVDLAMVTMFTYASLLAGRFFGPFALLAAPVLSRHTSAALKRFGLARWLRRRPRRQQPLLGVINVAVLAAVVVAGVWKAQAPLSRAFNERQQDENLPVGAAAWIREHRPDGEMFNPYNWGGYLMWVLWPDYRVFVDGRTDLYGDEFLREYLKVQYARPGYRDVLADHDIGFVLTYRDDVLSTHLACVEGWEKVYEDDGEGGVAVIWVRVR